MTKALSGKGSAKRAKKRIPSKNDQIEAEKAYKLSKEKLKFMIIDCISDLHGHYPELEGGDLLIIAGDLTSHGRRYQYHDFGEWVSKQNYGKKVVIAGNHDNLISGTRWNFCTPKQYGWDFEYLCDSGTEFEGLKIWGSPWTLTFPGINPHCASFTGTEEELEAKFKLIPDDTDILITHSPPWGCGDAIDVICEGLIIDKHLGSNSLINRVMEMESFPKLWVFGHVHEGYGIVPILRRKRGVMVNCSHVNEYYKPVNRPIRIEILQT